MRETWRPTHGRQNGGTARDRESLVPTPGLTQPPQHERLIAALEKLSDKDRDILRLVEWEGLTREQVAEMFFIPRVAIDQRITRA